MDHKKIYLRGFSLSGQERSKEDGWKKVKNWRANQETMRSDDEKWMILNLSASAVLFKWECTFNKWSMLDCLYSQFWENCNNFPCGNKTTTSGLTYSSLNYGSSNVAKRFNWNILHPLSHIKNPWPCWGNKVYLPWLSLGFLPPWTWSWYWPGLCRCRCRWCSPLNLPLSFQWPQMKTRSWGPEEKISRLD